MGKQIKTTNYFSHDSNARNDEKVIRLRMKHGAAGYGIYFMILERLREDANYMSVKDYNMIAFDLRVDAALVKSIVEDFGLFTFTEDGKHFYSDSFARRMYVMEEARSRRSVAGKKGGAPVGNSNARKRICRKQMLRYLRYLHQRHKPTMISFLQSSSARATRQTSRL